MKFSACYKAGVVTVICVAMAVAYQDYNILSTQMHDAFLTGFEHTASES